LFLRGLEEDDVLDRYDRFVVTRSDFVWLCPHPPLSLLDRGFVWIPDGEDYGGITDRHLVVSREDLTASIDLIDDIVLWPEKLYEEMKHRDDWSPEVFLKFHLARRGLAPRVRRFPYVMYTARGLHETPSTWSPGRFDPSVKHVVKYPSEFTKARAYATVIRTKDDWERGEWKTLDLSRALAAYDPSPMQRYVTWPVRDVYWGLRRPGRGARIGRVVRRALSRLDPGLRRGRNEPTA
jgi:hypothetical protein